MRRSGIQQNGEPPLLLPVKEPDGFRWNVAGIEAALDLLGITAPVVVKWANGYRRSGAHRWRDGRHVITVSVYTPGDKASETLWHELVHAAQQERLGVDFDAAYRRGGGGVIGTQAYWDNPFEVEAREVAAAYAADFPLTRGRS